MYSRDSAKSPTPSTYQQTQLRILAKRKYLYTNHLIKLQGRTKSKEIALTILRKVVLKVSSGIQPVFQQIGAFRLHNGRCRERSLVTGAGIQSLDLKIRTPIREAIEGFPRMIKLDLSKDCGGRRETNSAGSSFGYGGLSIPRLIFTREANIIIMDLN